MARGINKVILVGNLGGDPTVNQTTTGGTIARVTLATTETWKDKDGKLAERTEWHKVVFFNKLAEIVGQYLKKGSKVYVEGSLRTNKWQDKSGAERYTTEIVASEMLMLDGRSSATSSYAASGTSPHSSPQAGSSDSDFTDLPF